MELRTHYLNCFGYMYSCTLCEVTFTARRYFLFHMRKKHKVPASSLPLSTLDRRLNARRLIIKSLATKREKRRTTMMKNFKSLTKDYIYIYIYIYLFGPRAVQISPGFLKVLVFVDLVLFLFFVYTLNFLTKRGRE